MAKFASHTDVPVAKSRAEIEAMLARYKATATGVFTSTGQAAVAFEMHGRRVLFRLALPESTAKEFQTVKVNQSRTRRASPEQVERQCEMACRRKWRALLLAIKAKLVAVDDGIETFEEAFMAHVVMPDGSTVAEHVRPRIASAYSDGKMVPLLPPPPANR